MIKPVTSKQQKFYNTYLEKLQECVNKYPNEYSYDDKQVKIAVTFTPYGFAHKSKEYIVDYESKLIFKDSEYIVFIAIPKIKEKKTIRSRKKILKRQKYCFNF